MVKAIFFDRDGVLVKSIRRPEKPVPTPPWSWKEFEMLPFAIESTALVKSAGFNTFIVTNQPDVNDKYTTRATVCRINDFIKRKCSIDEVVVCYDRSSVNYKPSPGMLYDLRKKYNIDFKRSYTVGDRWRDIVCGYHAGTYNILVHDGNDDIEWPDKYNHIQPDYVCSNVFEACEYILKREVQLV